MPGMNLQKASGQSGQSTSAGPPGPAGPAGADGLAGADGAQGTPGTPGKDGVVGQDIVANSVTINGAKVMLEGGAYTANYGTNDEMVTGQGYSWTAYIK